MELQIAATVPCTGAEGPHQRFALWVQGCTLGCPGCCNPSMFDPARGRSVTVTGLVGQIDPDAVEGITVLGGEPLQQLPAVTELCEQSRARGLGVVVFTGYRLEEARLRPGFSRLWAALDTLVDGRFDRRRPDRVRRFIGSTNQGLHHRTERYADPALWTGPDQAEVRISPDGVVSVHGVPGLSARVAHLLSTRM